MTKREIEAVNEARKRVTLYASRAEGPSEANFGITEYIDAQPATFEGILKQRFADFLVNEIDLDGNVVELSSFDLPVMPQEAAVDVDFDEQVAIKYLHAALQVQVEQMIRDKEGIVTTAKIEDKDERMHVHNLIKTKWAGKVKSTTSDGCIVISLGKERPRVQRYTSFLMWKENKDTMDALNKLARAIGAPTHVFTYAGTKDRRAITVQRVVGHKVQPERLMKVNSMEHLGIKVGNFGHPNENLALGDLGGNRFTIVLRSAKILASMDEFESALRRFAEYGFINYFGMQRFGTGSVSTDLIGEKILKSNWKEAVDLILDVRSDDSDDIRKAKEAWLVDGNAEESLKMLPRRCLAERAVIQVLKKTPNDYSNAIRAIQRGLRQMYVHAYQSRIWNTAASERIRKYGMNPVVGDIVHVERGVSGKVEYREWKVRTNVKCIETAEEASKYSIEDILLPLPGDSVIYPSNEIGEVYKRLIDDDGIDFGSTKRGSEFQLTGDYRFVIGKPGNLEWDLKHYDDPLAPLVLDDYARLLKAEEPQDKGENLAIILKFNLKSSQYATVALREVLKIPTTSVFHARLSLDQQFFL